MKQLLEDQLFIRDFVPELPVEIRLSITNYLDVSDLINIRGVSRRWFQSWTQVPICNKLMKENFRSAFENSYSLLPDEQKPSAFIAASDRLHSMQNGDYYSMKILNYQTPRLGEPSPVFDRLYNNGRVAWSIEERVMVSTICSGTIRTYMSPHRENMKILALSDKVIVATAGDK